MSESKNITHEVTRGGINLLVSCMSQPGWAKEPAKLYAAGGLLEELDDQFGADKQPEPPEEPVALLDHEKKVKDWADRKVTLELTEKQREAAKVALTHFISQGNISATKHFCILGRALGLE